MQRLTTIIGNNKADAWGNYLVFDKEKGLIAFNGIEAINYRREVIGPQLNELLKEHPFFIILDGIRFLRILKIITKTTQLLIDTSTNELSLIFNDKRGTIKVGVSFDKNIPHMELAWKKHNPDFNKEDNAIKLLQACGDMVKMVSDSGKLIWNQEPGVHNSDGNLIAVDAEIITILPSNSNISFFWPKRLLTIKVSDLDYFYVGETSAHLVGETVQLQTARFKAIDDANVFEIKEIFNHSKAYIVKLVTDSQTWKRSDLYKDSQFFTLKLIIKNGSLLLTSSQGDWKEIIGEADLPDNESYVSATVLQNWTKSSKDHKITISPSGEYYLYSKSYSGYEFYGKLSIADYSEPNNDENGDEDGDGDDLMELV